jgi:hypothetical protein
MGYFFVAGTNRRSETKRRRNRVSTSRFRLRSVRYLLPRIRPGGRLHDSIKTSPEHIYIITGRTRPANMRLYILYPQVTRYRCDKYVAFRPGPFIFA